MTLISADAGTKGKIYIGEDLTNYYDEENKNWHFYGDISTNQYKSYWGAGDDSSIGYDGTNLIINPKEVGSGYLNILGSVEIDTNLDVEGIQIYENAFVFTLTATNSSVAVTFPTAFAGGVTPVVICTPPYQTSFWITNITNTGFTFNVGTTNAYNQTINCIAMGTS